MLKKLLSVLSSEATFFALVFLSTGVTEPATTKAMSVETEIGGKSAAIGCSDATGSGDELGSDAP